jgi:ERF superfamily
MTQTVDKPDLATTDHVLSAIREVMAEVIGIAKAGEMRNRRGDVQYNFQRYEDMAGAVGKVFRSAGVATQTVLAAPPNVYHWEKPTQDGKTLWTWVQVSMRFALTSLVDGSTFTVEALGEGLDSSDKATNKAMTSAYKNALKIAFTLSTADDKDPDATRPTMDTPREQVSQNGQQHQPPPEPIWAQVEQVARGSSAFDPEPARVEAAQRVKGSVGKANTTGDLAQLAQWASDRRALDVDVDGVMLARRLWSFRSTLRVGAPSPRQPADDARASTEPPEPERGY